MAEIPDSLRCLFSASIEERADSYVVELPREEIEQSALTPGAVYRIAVLAQGPTEEPDESTESRSQERPAPSEPREPPVETGEIRTVAVETTGDQGDGIAKVDRGYVLIIPGGEPGDELTVEIQQVHENFAIAEIVSSEY